MAPVYSRVSRRHVGDQYNTTKSHDWFDNLSSQQKIELFDQAPPPRLFDVDYITEEERRAARYREYQPPTHNPAVPSSSLPPRYSSHPQYQPPGHPSFYPQEFPPQPFYPQSVPPHPAPPLPHLASHQPEAPVEFPPQNTRVRQEGSVKFYRDLTTNRFVGQYHGHSIEISEQDYANNTDETPNLRIVEEDNTGSEASTALVEFNRPFNPDEFQLPVIIVTPPADEHVDPQPSTDTVESEDSSTTLESEAAPVTTEDKEPAFPYLKTRSGPSASNKGKKTKKNKGRNGKARKNKHKRRAMASKSAKSPVGTKKTPVGTNQANSGMTMTPVLRAASPTAGATSTTSSEDWSVVHKEKFARQQRAAAAPHPALPDVSPVALAAVNNGNVSRSWASVVAAGPANTTVVPVGAVDSVMSTPSHSCSGAAVAPRAVGASAPRSNTQDEGLVCEEETAQSVDGSGAMAEGRGESACLAAQQAEQKESDLPLDSHSMTESSCSHKSHPGEVVPPRMSIPSASDSQQIQQSGHLEGGSQAAVRSAEYASWCGFVRSCCTHVPYWFQENPAGLEPYGCCCNHWQHLCCFCLPPGLQWRMMDGAFLVMEDSGLAAIPEEEASLTEASQSGQSHAQPSFTAQDPTQSTSSFPLGPSPSFTHPPSPAAFPLPGNPAVTMPPSSVSGSPPLPAKKTAEHRVIPVIPLGLHRPAGSERIVSETASTKGNDQRELSPSVVSLFDHARQTRTASAPAAQVDSVIPHSHRESRDTAPVKDNAEDSNSTHPDESQSLSINRLRLTAPSAEQGFRSPSLYFDAKQQLSSPAQSSDSRSSSPKKSCVKTMPSTPTPRVDSPPRSVQLSDGMAPGQSPEAKDDQPGDSPPLRSRVSSRRSSVQSEAAVDTMGHVQSLWHDTNFKDLSIVLQPHEWMKQDPRFSRVDTTVFWVHKSIVSASPFLRHAIEFLYERDGNVSVIRAFAGSEFHSAIPFRKALVTLYGKKLLTLENIRHVTLKSLGLPDDDGNGSYPWSINRAQVQFALSYAAAGAFLARREIVARGIEMALSFLSWETAEHLLGFAMAMRCWMITCPDIVFTPSGSPHDDKSKAHEVGRTACHDFHFYWVEKVKNAVLQFFADNTLPGFELYDHAQSGYYPTRIPGKLWTWPNSWTANPALEYMRFGSMPSLADRRPSRPDCLVVSSLLITLPWTWFMDFLELLKAQNKMSVALLKQVVEQREERRLHALRVYHRNAWETDAIDEDELNGLGYREFVSGELSPHDNNAIATTTVQRVWVGLGVPNMTPGFSRPLRPSDLVFPGLSPQVLAPATTSQGASTAETTGEASDRGRQKKRKKNKGKGKKKSPTSTPCP